MSVFDDPNFATNTNYGAGNYPGQTNKARPPAGNIAEGLDPQFGAPAEWLNYFFNLAGKWISAFRDSTVTLKGLITDSVGNNVGNRPTIDWAQIFALNSAGYARAVLVDRHGLPEAGWITHLVEDWTGTAQTISGNGNNQQLANPLGRWQTAIDVQGGAVTGTIAPVAYGVGTGAEMQSGATNAQIMALATAFAPLDTSSITNYSAVLGFDATFPNVSNVNFYLGFGDDPTLGANAGPGELTYALFDTVGGGNWKARSANGGGPTATDTGVAIAATSHRFRVEIHGSGSPFGAATARFFIDEQIVATHTTNVPLGRMHVVFGMVNGTNSARTLFVGQVGLAFNRYAGRDAI